MIRKLSLFSIFLLLAINGFASKLSASQTIYLHNLVSQGGTIAVAGDEPFQVITSTCNTPHCIAKAVCPTGHVVYQGYAYSILPNGGTGNSVRFCGFQSSICAAGLSSCSIQANVQNSSCIKPAWLEQTTVVYVICRVDSTHAANRSQK